MESNWSKPIIVNSPWLGRVLVTGPFHALTLLMEAWPAMSGPHFLKARIACSAALQGRVSVEDARLAFDLATREAGDQMKVMRGDMMARPGAGVRVQ